MKLNLKINKNLKMKTIVLILLVVSFFFLVACTPQPKNIDTFAQCLTEKGTTMYGTEWCPHCKNQKELFGKSFQYINFIDCDQNPNICSEAGIRGYPTWDINGNLFPGEQSFEKLGQYSGCKLK